MDKPSASSKGTGSDNRVRAHFIPFYGNVYDFLTCKCLSDMSKKYGVKQW